MRTAMTPLSATCVRWPSRCSKRPGCCRTSTRGSSSWEDFQRLKPVAPSMGMMLETTSKELFEKPGGPHFGSPDKDPAVRLRVIEDAGRCTVAFTTGILVGIGETYQDRIDAIFALRKMARQYGHIQEVLIQGFRAKPDTAMRSSDDLEAQELLAAIAVSRLVLGPGLACSRRPTLSSPRTLRGSSLPASTISAASAR